MNEESEERKTITVIGLLDQRANLLKVLKEGDLINRENAKEQILRIDQIILQLNGPVK